MKISFCHFSGLDDMEEKVYDPRELFHEIGVLITEARIPDLSTKGRIEGPHCPPANGVREHECDRHKEQVSLPLLILNYHNELFLIRI